MTFRFKYKDRSAQTEQAMYFASWGTYFERGTLHFASPRVALIVVTRGDSLKRVNEVTNEVT